MFLPVQQQGIIIDFIGNTDSPSKFYLLWLDTVIFMLQTILLVTIFLEAPSNPVPSPSSSRSSSRSSLRSTRTAPAFFRAEQSRTNYPIRPGSDELDHEERTIGVDVSEPDETLEGNWENELVVDIQFRQALRNWMYVEDDGAGEGLRGRERRLES